jgi:imidazolonepropionase-like amidohydrolase
MTKSTVVTPLLICLAVVVWTSGPLAQNTSTSGTLAITNVTVIDATGAAPRDKMMLILKGSTIEYVGRVDELSIPQRAQVLDMSGHFVIPGLIESHTHLRPLAAISQARLDAELDRMLHGGIVTARVMGPWLPQLHMEVSREAEAGGIPSPDIYYAMTVAGSHFLTSGSRGARAQPSGAAADRRLEGAIDSTEDIAAVVVQARRGGASALKMVAELRGPVMRGIADAAHRAGLRVWAHSMVFPDRPIDTVRAGADGVSHACGLVWQDPDLDPSPYTQIDTALRPRFDPTLVDIDGPEMRTLFEEMARRGTVFDPTLVVQSRPDIEKYGCTSKLLVALTRAAHRAGVTIAAGTDFHADAADLYPALHQEIELLVSSGVLTPLEAITAATRNGARALGREKIEGTIEPGKLANLVILTADPSQDIRALRTVVTVVKRGQLYARTDYLVRR